jgi:hypothetical protein
MGGAVAGTRTLAFIPVRVEKNIVTIRVIF